jgi:putative DNA primase/helicase
MTQGCLEWQQKGLAPPNSVTQATEEYLAAEDVISAWIEDCCVRDAGSHTSTRKLFDSWKPWAEQASHFIGDEKRFAGKLDDAGFRWERVNRVRGYWGLRLRPADDPEPEIPF